MWQQHAIVGAATALPCENERRRALGAERECDPLARWARARLLIAAAKVVVAAWSAAARPRFFGILAGRPHESRNAEEVAKSGDGHK